MKEKKDVECVSQAVQTTVPQKTARQSSKAVIRDSVMQLQFKKAEVPI